MEPATPRPASLAESQPGEPADLPALARRSGLAATLVLHAWLRAHDHTASATPQPAARMPDIFHILGSH